MHRDYNFRFYRDWMTGENRSRISLIQGESDLLVLCPGDHRDEADRLLRQARAVVMKAASDIPGFCDSLAPIHFEGETHPLIRAMVDASSAWNVGPMASVAGAIAHHVAQGLSHSNSMVVVENGGDTFIFSPEPVTFRVYAGENSPFPVGFGFTVDASGGISVCASSGRVGPSWSAGLADAVVAVAGEGAVADAAATSIANLIAGECTVDPVIESAAVRKDLTGLIVMAGNRMGVWGDLELVTLKGA